MEEECPTSKSVGDVEFSNHLTLMKLTLMVHKNFIAKFVRNVETLNKTQKNCYTKKKCGTAWLIRPSGNQSMRMKILDDS